MESRGLDALTCDAGTREPFLNACLEFDRSVAVERKQQDLTWFYKLLLHCVRGARDHDRRLA